MHLKVSLQWWHFPWTQFRAHAMRLGNIHPFFVGWTLCWQFLFPFVSFLCMNHLACLEVGVVLGWSWLSVLFYWHEWHVCVTMTAGAAAHQPAVKAVTVRSVLTSACDFSLRLGVQNWSKILFLRHPRTLLFACVPLKSNFLGDYFFWF